MARRIIWSKRAQTDRKSIFSYWNNRNKSNFYSKKLNKLFVKATELIAIYPQIGRTTTTEKIRVKFVNHFALIYEYSETQLDILAIFDTRQNPKKLDKIVSSNKD